MLKAGASWFSFALEILLLQAREGVAGFCSGGLFWFLFTQTVCKKHDTTKNPLANLAKRISRSTRDDAVPSHQNSNAAQHLQSMSPAEASTLAAAKLCRMVGARSWCRSTETTWTVCSKLTTQGGLAVPERELRDLTDVAHDK